MANVKLILSASLCLMLVACAPAPQGQGSTGDASLMQQIKQQMANLEQRFASLTREKNQGPSTKSEARQLADLQAELDNLRVEVQSLAGRMDEVDRTNSRLKDEIGLLRDEMMLKDAALDQRLTAVEGGTVAAASQPKTPATTAAEAPSSTPSSATTAPSPAPVEKKEKPAQPESPSVDATDPNDQYKAALALIQKENDFVKGEAKMRDFLQKNSSDPLAVNAMYWIGEALYGQKRYEESILQLQDVIAQFGDHPKVAAALLKQAIAFDTLGDRASAKATLQKLQARFPLAPESESAKVLLEQWQ